MMALSLSLGLSSLYFLSLGLGALGFLEDSLNEPRLGFTLRVLRSYGL